MDQPVVVAELVLSDRVEKLPLDRRRACRQVCDRRPWWPVNRLQRVGPGEDNDLFFANDLGLSANEPERVLAHEKHRPSLVYAPLKRSMLHRLFDLGTRSQIGNHRREPFVAKSVFHSKVHTYPRTGVIDLEQTRRWLIGCRSCRLDRANTPSVERSTAPQERKSEQKSEAYSQHLEFSPAT